MIKIESPYIDEICSHYADSVISRPRRFKGNRFAQYLFNSNRLHSIICCPADKLQEIISDFDEHFPDKENDEWAEFRNYMINQYNLVRNEFLPSVLEKLDLAVCPYCNRHYIYTVNKGRKVGAQFDHFYSKSKYPYLALSFYNLIPCCPSCNKAKGDENIKINPYVEGFDANASINIDYPLNCILGNNDLSIQFHGNDRTMSNIQAFVLDDLYKRHRDIAQEIVFKEIANEHDYLSALKDEFCRMGIDSDLAHRILWGYYVAENEMCKRPLSKMASDIIKQIQNLY